MPPRSLLRAMFDAAVAAVSAERCAAHLPPPPAGRTIVVGAGKAAAAMAAAVERAWTGELDGVVVVPHRHGAPCRRIRVIEAGHPVPDEAGVAAAAAILAAVSGLAADDLVLCLLSGGGSALLPALPPGVTLADEQALARALLRSGAAIAEINCVRKHVSTIKGGRLARAARPAAVTTLVLSDVPGDDPATVASGPTLADATTRAEALAILARHAIDPPPAIAAWLAAPASETPRGAELGAPDCRVVATAADALAAAAGVARAAGYAPLILGDAIEGEAAAVARDQAALVRAVLAGRGPIRPPCALLSGGELSVTVRGNGRGGRNAEFLLALALALDGAPGVHALAADTDGIDGTGDNAGALLDPATLARAAAAGLDAADHLRRNDSYPVFAATGDLVVTGPTRTNVNDLRAILIDPRG